VEEYHVSEEELMSFYLVFPVLLV